MIKGKAKMEFGTGDIFLLGGLNEGDGVLFCMTQEPHEINERKKVEADWSAKKCDVIISFTRTESIDALIAELQNVKAMMEGTYQFNADFFEEPFDLDAFMEGGGESGK